MQTKLVNSQSFNLVSHFFPLHCEVGFKFKLRVDFESCFSFSLLGDLCLAIHTCDLVFQSLRSHTYPGEFYSMVALHYFPFFYEVV